MWPSDVGDELVVTIITQGNDEYSPLKKKQKQKKQWTEKTMSEALNCCKNQELGIEEASLIYGIPKRSLRLRLNKNFSLIDDKYRVFLVPNFPLQAELELLEYLQGLIQSQFTFTSVEVRRLAYELISEKYNLNNLPQEKDCLLGNRWYKTFMTKYPLLESENIFESFHDKSSRFYDALEATIAEHEIDSSRIFSVDGIELKFRASNAYDLDKIYHRRKIIYTDAKAICCISAAGEFVPPLFIKPEEKGSNKTLSLFIVHENENDFQTYTDNCAYKENPSENEVGSCNKIRSWSRNGAPPLPTAEEVANIKNQIKAHLNKKLQSMSEENEEELREKLYEQFDKLRSKTTISRHENGLNVVSNEVFHEWFQNFVSHVRPSLEKKVILLVSDQNLVKSLKTLQMGKANGIVFLLMPPHSVHKIHPLDGFTMSLNRNLSTCASIWLGKNPDFKIQEVPLFELFKMAYKDSVNTSIAKNGFMYSGIWPVNRNIFESTELGGESILLKSRIQTSSYNSEAGQSDRQTIFVKPDSADDKVIDISKLCRVCMKEKMYMKPLFDARDPNYHGKKISEIIEKLISPDDGLPEFICQYCLVQLMEMVKIKNITIESNKTMIKIRELLNGFFYDNDDSEKVLLSELQYQLSKQTNAKLMEKFLTKDFEIDSICRICMSEKPLMTSIFYFPHSGINYYPDLSTRIMKVSNCQVSLEDGLSSSICAFCRTSINQAWEFIHKVLGSNKRFQEILSERHVK